MKSLKSILLALLVCTLFGCSNPDFDYNESTSAVFLNEMKSIDELHQSFSDSGKVFHLSHGDQVSLKAKAESIENTAQQDIQYLNGLKPGVAAKEFHQAVNSYFSKIEHYGKTAQTLLSADLNKRKTIYLALMNEYEALNRMPDRTLEIQKEYLNKVGLHAK